MLAEYLVKFDYSAKLPNELTIKEGDKIVNAEIISTDWCKGTVIGKTGQIPENYVKLYTKSFPPELLSLLGNTLIPLQNRHHKKHY